MNITKTTMLYNDYGEEKDKMIEIHDPLICHHEMLGVSEKSRTTIQLRIYNFCSAFHCCQ